MGFDFDNQDQANISAADFAIMCDEMRELREQRDKLADALRDILQQSGINGSWAQKACSALAKYDRKKVGK